MIEFLIGLYLGIGLGITVTAFTIGNDFNKLTIAEKITALIIIPIIWLPVLFIVLIYDLELPKDK